MKCGNGSFLGGPSGELHHDFIANKGGLVIYDGNFLVWQKYKIGKHTHSQQHAEDGEYSQGISVGEKLHIVILS